MRFVVCSVRDGAVGFGRPVFVASTGQAIRSFQDEVNRVDPENPMQKHPGDFDLFHLGWFDDEFGKFQLLDQPEQLATGRAVAAPGGK